MRTSAFASMCLSDDVLGGDQQVSGCPAGPSQVTMTSNPLSLFSKLAALSVQQPGCGYTDALISALRNKEDDKLAEAKKDDPLCVLSSVPMSLGRYRTTRFSRSLLRRLAL